MRFLANVVFFPGPKSSIRREPSVFLLTPLWYIQLVVSKYISENYNVLMARKEGEDYILDTIQYFFYELGMKPHMQL